MSKTTITYGNAMMQPAPSIHQEKNVISFIAHDAQVEVHKHHCFQILLGLTSTFDSVIHGHSHTGRRLLIINQTVAHACNGLGGSNLIFFIDAESSLGWQLKQMLDGREIVDLSDEWGSAHASSPAMGEIRAWSPLQLQTAADEALAFVTEGSPQLVAGRDERIRQAIEWMQQHLHEKIALPDVAAQIHLSPERTRHLFVQEAGVSFSQFLMWKRIKVAIVLAVGEGARLTEAAARAGFADQAHFSRLFKRTFGIPAGGLLRNSRSIQFIHPRIG